MDEWMVAGRWVVGGQAGFRFWTRRARWGQLLHRPLSGFAGYTMCGRLVENPAALLRRKPAGLDDCQACRAFAREAREEATERAARADRWRTGWIVVGDPRLAHRPDPADPAMFMCRMTVPVEHTLLPARPVGINECGRCAMFVARARKKAAKTDPLHASRPVDPERVDRIDRTRQRGTSVRTVTGGLPTLGQRH